MTLYRNISIEELFVLLEKGRVERKREEGIYFFLEPREYTIDDPYRVMVRVDVDDERVITYTTGTYVSDDDFDGIWEGFVIDECLLDYYDVNETTLLYDDMYEGVRSMLSNNSKFHSKLPFGWQQDEFFESHKNFLNKAVAFDSISTCSWRNVKDIRAMDTISNEDMLFDDFVRHLEKIANENIKKGIHVSPDF